MKRRILCVMMLLGPAGPTPALAQLEEAWAHWRYLRSIELAPVAESQLVRVDLPIELYGVTQSSLADLRVIRDDGSEVPFVLYARVGKEEREWRPAEIADLGFVPGAHTEIVIDVGSDHDAHNALEIQTGVNEFFVWVDVAGSDDAEHWRILNEKAPIYRYADTREGNTVVTYPESETRWLRVRVLDSERRFAVYGCRVAYQLVELPELAGLPGTMRFDPAGAPQESRWQMDLGVENVPASSVRFEAVQPEFHRTVQVHIRGEETDWEEVGRGDIYRYAAPPSEGDQPEMRTALQVRFAEARARYWRVSVLNRNDLPIAGLAFQLEGTPRHVVFRQEPGATYRLVYGHPRTAGPEYDLPRLIPREELEAALAVGLGDESVNTAYQSPEPWTERHPALLWLALVVAVAVLGMLTLRALR